MAASLESPPFADQRDQRGCRTRSSRSGSPSRTKSRRQSELLEAADKTLNELIEKRAREMAKSAEIDAQLRDTSGKRNQLAQDTHDADVREARLEVQIQQATERLLDEYEVSYEQALAWPEDIEIERGTASEVARLRREIKDMGPVNTGAVQEYERIKERWDFLTEQRADLESARDQIMSAIREIDQNTRGLFMETFNKVAGNFDTMFRRLFGGGKTQLSLTDPEQPAGDGRGDYRPGARQEAAGHVAAFRRREGFDGHCAGFRAPYEQA